VTAVGFEPTPLRTGALSQRLRPLGQTVLPVVGDREARGCGEDAWPLRRLVPGWQHEGSKPKGDGQQEASASAAAV
jgi:hypothetical protein